MASNRIELIQKISDELNDLLELRPTVTATVPGTFTDQLNVYPGTEAIIGSFLVFGVDADGDPGTNYGHIARVTNTNKGAGVIDFAPVAPALPADGDTIYMVNLGANGWHPYQYLRTIKTIALEISPEFRTQTMVTFTDNPWVISDTSFDYDVESIESVAYMPDDEDGTWIDVPRAYERGGDGWWVDDNYADAQLWIDGSYAEVIDDAELRAVVSTSIDSESFDALAMTDVIPIDDEYMVVEGTWRMLGMGVRKDPTRFTLQQNLTQRRERAKTLVRTRITTETSFIRLT